MSEWTQPIETVGELIEQLQGLDPDQTIRVAVGYRERRVVKAFSSDDPRDGSTVYLFAVPLADAAGKVLADAGWQVTSGWVQEHGGPVVCVWAAQLAAASEVTA